MKPLVLIKILNLLNAILVTAFMFKIFHFFHFLNPFSIFHFIVAAIVIYGLKSWVEIRHEISDPIRENKITNALYNLGIGLTILGVLIKIMHWPFWELMFVTGSISIFVATIISFFVDPSKRESNAEILDDIDE